MDLGWDFFGVHFYKASWLCDYWALYVYSLYAVHTVYSFHSDKEIAVIAACTSWLLLARRPLVDLHVYCMVASVHGSSGWLCTSTYLYRFRTIDFILQT